MSDAEYRGPHHSSAGLMQKDALPFTKSLDKRSFGPCEEILHNAQAQVFQFSACRNAEGDQHGPGVEQPKKIYIPLKANF